jgi:hypothetical protein
MAIVVELSHLRRRAMIIELGKASEVTRAMQPIGRPDGGPSYPFLADPM